MRYIKCPKCKLNYIDADKEELCSICRKGVKPPSGHGEPKEIKGPVRYKGKAIFFMFQNGEEYPNEAREGVIKAPYYDEGMREPHHWARLLNVREGDVILYGVDGFILAISEAKGPYCDFTYGDGRLGRKVNCDYHLLRQPLITAKYKKEIIENCMRYEYQPFNKNGTGNQGYLFDLCYEVAKLFLVDIVKHNSAIAKLPFIKEIL